MVLLTWTSQGQEMLLYLTHELPVNPSMSESSLTDNMRTHHMAAQPSASWKLKAISVPFDSVHTMRVSGDS